MREHDRSRWANRRAPDRDPWREHDACGVGCVARASGERSSGIVALALQALARVAHRGAASTDHSGDGAGLLVQIPRAFFHREAARLGFSLAPEQPFAVGMFFLPTDRAARYRATTIVEDVLRGAGLPVLGWRDVPVEPAVLGPTARATCPTVRQAVIAAPAGGRQVDAPAWERSLYLARRIIEQRIAAAGPELEGFFACSLSCRTLVYKALLTGTQLPAFFPDLVSPDFESAIAVFHQRYSTNTSSSWALAQPFRLLGHNGEINTLWGNRNAMAAREPALASPIWDERIDRLKPVIWAEGSDSTSLDNALELLVRSGRDPVHALMMLVPEAHEGAAEMGRALRGFYEFHECLVEPWDGPAALAFTDGVIAGAALDRNGLRPCRYKITRDGLLVAGSEVGLVDLDPREVVESGSLGPGEVIVVDTRRQTILRNADAKREVARRRPYARWAARSVRPLRPAAGDPRHVAAHAPGTTRLVARRQSSRAAAGAHRAPDSPGRRDRGPAQPRRRSGSDAAGAVAAGERTGPPPQRPRWPVHGGGARRAPGCAHPDRERSRRGCRAPAHPDAPGDRGRASASAPSGSPHPPRPRRGSRGRLGRPSLRRAH